MRSATLTLLTGLILAVSTWGQTLSTEQKKIVDSARASYYSLESRGFVSATCSVNFDFSTVPNLPSANPEENLKVLESTQFTVILDRNGPTVLHSYTNGTANNAQQRAEPMVNLLSSLVRGLFLTWPTKGLHGPIPAFDSQIKSVMPTSDGYRLILSFPGDPVRIDMNKSYLVTEIVSVGGRVDERPEYSTTPDGLVFTGNAAIDNEPTGRIEVRYELGNTLVDGFLLPTSVHLQVNQNINVRFALNRCSVKKGVVISVQPQNTPNHHAK